MKEIKEIFDCLPEKVRRTIIKEWESEKNAICEIRLRALLFQSVVASGKEYIITEDEDLQLLPKNPLILSGKDLSDVVFKLCEGSVYAHFDELKNGYISKNGIRIGVCGVGILKNGLPSGFSTYSSINIRIPRHIGSCTDVLFSHINKNGLTKVGGILVVSPPNCGKTTFLRSFAARLSGGYFEKEVFSRKRVCVIDERGEIYSKEAFKNGLCDFISFLPKDYCIELATRVLSPQYIVCDEIGNEKDALSIFEGAAKGVIFAASCHGKTLHDILLKPSLKKLFDVGIFSTVCELYCVNGKFNCKITNLSEIFQND